ncbi:hypothetical protein BCR44DRAFT_1156533 [Catenaria anguillulae PL171]|uniref:Uncharacterized protein n=1 Tax=Catenaria anguillulae PL171 TaxID=765915 RepID=A0A1Y2HIF2_9FUNG|nr:hypothetical protein BCR44DRAFT_1156533 [Catenaria anguillulae PL171]
MQLDRRTKARRLQPRSRSRAPFNEKSIVPTRYLPTYQTSILASPSVTASNHIFPSTCHTHDLLAGSAPGCLPTPCYHALAHPLPSIHVHSHASSHRYRTLFFPFDCRSVIVRCVFLIALFHLFALIDLFPFISSYPFPSHHFFYSLHPPHREPR